MHRVSRVTSSAMKRRIGALLVGSCALACTPSWAAELYRYRDDNGVLVLDDSIPPKYAARGYTVLSPTGRVIRVVPRQLTPEEVAERDRQRAEEEAERRALAERYASDAELLRLYSSAEDLERARDRKLADIEALISTTRGNIQRLEIQKHNLEMRAAELERAGQEVSPELIDNMSAIDAQIREKESEIASRAREQDRVRQQFSEDLKRFRQLRSAASG